MVDESAPDSNTAAAPDSGPAPHPLVVRLSLLPRERRSGVAITHDDIAEAARLDVAPFADLCEGLRAIGVTLGSFRERVNAARPKRKGTRGHLRLVDVPASDAGPPDERPVITIDDDRMHEAVASGVRALSVSPGIYQRNNMLVHVIGAPEPEEHPHDRAPQAPGTPSIRVMAQPTLWETSARAARWRQFDARAGSTVPTPPPGNVVAAILARGCYPGICELQGIIEHPAMRPDGSIINDAGYDAATGFLYSPAIQFLPCFEDPTPEEANAALIELDEVFADFPFCDSAARMVPVAAVLTLIARPAIDGAIPGVFVDSNVRSAGKSRMVDAIVLLATGRLPPPMNYPSTDDELEKILGAYALRGPQAIKFDNVTRPFGGGPLDRVLTAPDKVPMRVLGQSEIPELAWRALVLGTGNCLVTAGDTARRLLVARLESKLENPENRPETEFKHADLLGWIRQERPRLVRAALTVLRAYVVAGRPRSFIVDNKPYACKSWGSFESWAALIPTAIVHAGGADPMGARLSMSGEEEPEKAALLSLLNGLRRLDSEGRGLTARDIVTALYPGGKQPNPAHGPPDGYDDMREGIEAMVRTKQGAAPSSADLGYRLRGAKRRPVGGLRLAADTTRSPVRWRAEVVS